jgi:hypothetical protein
VNRPAGMDCVPMPGSAILSGIVCDGYRT